MPRVFIPQVPSRFDTTIGQWVPTVSIGAAASFGELRVMLPPEASRLSIEQVAALLKTAMNDYGEDDYLLAIGSPVIYAVAAAIAYKQTDGLLRLLEWDRMDRRYKDMEVQI